MEDNNPYKRRYKTKNEQYQEKLRQRSNSQDWLFGNIFGKPGGGAPLRDNQGNIISHLKTINNDNIFKFQPDYFSKGNNNISILNNNINNPRNTSTTQNSFQNNKKNLLSSRNQSISFQENNSNNQFLQNNYEYNKNNPLILNQSQIHFGYTIIPLQNIIPLNQVYSLQRNNNFPYYFKNMTSTPSINNRAKIITPSINYMNRSQEFSNQKENNINKEDHKIDNSSEVNNIKINENEEDNLFINNDNDRNNRLQNEKKLEEWKNDLRKQMEEQKKRKEDAKRKEAEEDKEEERKYKEFLIYKNKQNEENKKNKSKLKKIRNQQSQNQSIEINKANNNTLEQSQHSKINDEIQNLPFEEFENEPYNQNNPLNEYNITPEMIKEQENLKNYIDNQYDSLGDVLNQNIQNEIDKMSSKLIKNYENFTDEEKYKLFKASKFTNITAERNNKKIQKLHDIIEERNLLNFIIGRDDKNFSTIKYQNYDINKYNQLSSKMPSFFGKNVIPYENVNKQLNSEAHFIYGGHSNTWKEKENNDVFRQKELKYNEKDKDTDKYYKNNNIIRKFGKNKNENINIQSLDFSQSLDNKSSFVPLDKNEMKKNINQNYDIINDNLSETNKQKNLNIVQDPIEENIIKNLNEIDKLNKKVILYNKDGTEIKENNDVQINNQTNENQDNNN